MNDALRFLYVVVILVAFRPIVSFASMLLYFTRLTLEPQRVEDAPGDARLDAAARACLAELASLGFDVIRTRRDVGLTDTVTSLVLRHREVPAFAEVALRAEMNVGYLVTFYSFDAAHRMLVTSNRHAWLDLAADETVLWEDAFAPSLNEQWRKHRARLGEFAARAIDDAQGAGRIAHWTETYVEVLQAAGHVVRIDGRFHYSFRSGLRLALRYMRLRRRLAAPFSSTYTAAQSATNQGSLDSLAVRLGEIERAKARLAPRRDIKLAMLAGSLVLSLLAWGIFFGWSQGIAILAIIFFHEMGHAVVMRGFGYRDMSMFFVPFVGAVVTGAPRQLTAWKQAAVLFAGPLPGLLAGVALVVYLSTQPAPLHGAFDWRAVAYLAIGINLFNLLPFTPLDGGQLVELALFARWPTVRFVFFVASTLALAGFAVFSKSIAAWVLTGILASTLVTQWRLARLQRVWRSDLAPEERFRLLAAAAEQMGVRGFARQYALIRSLTTRQEIARPSLWESAAVVAVLGAVWGATAFVVLYKPGL